MLALAGNNGAILVDLAALTSSDLLTPEAEAAHARALGCRRRGGSWSRGGGGGGGRGH